MGRLGPIPLLTWEIPAAVQGDAVAVAQGESSDRGVVPIGAVENPHTYEGGGRLGRQSLCDSRGFVARGKERLFFAGNVRDTSE